MKQLFIFKDSKIKFFNQQRIQHFLLGVGCCFYLFFVQSKQSKNGRQSQRGRQARKLSQIRPQGFTLRKLLEVGKKRL